MANFDSMMVGGVYVRLIKPIFDLLMAGALLVLLTPIMLVLGLLNLVLDGHLFFRQKRPGLNEEIFALWKFKTMKSPSYEGQEDVERITQYGAFLRKYSLDELPQLVNILLGQMSFVGPRPYLVEYLELYSQNHAKRHYVKPGITGLAQVNGRNTLSWADRLDRDVEYINRISFWLDLNIIWLTFVQLAKTKDINEEGQIGSSKFTGYA